MKNRWWTPQRRVLISGWLILFARLMIFVKNLNHAGIKCWWLRSETTSAGQQLELEWSQDDQRGSPLRVSRLLPWFKGSIQSFVGGQNTTLRSVAGKATVDWTSVCLSNSEPGQSADTQPTQGIGGTNDTGIRLREDFDSQRLIGHIGCNSSLTSSWKLYLVESGKIG